MQTNLLAFSAVAFGLVLTPGPNMMYLVSRSLCQGRRAGFISLLGVASAFVVYLLFSALGITALALRVPVAFEFLRVAGALYLAYLAWKIIRPGGRSPFEVTDLPRDPPGRLFGMGFLTNLLNPKAAILYVSLLPQFIEPRAGSVLLQSVVLGLVQMAISLSVNGLLILAASTVAGLLSRHPSWAAAQRWVMGGVLGALAVRMAIERVR